MTNAQKVLTLINEYEDGLDDDEISEKLGIKPRQQVYQICTTLESRGEIVRRSVEKPGKRRKIHNFPAADGTSDARLQTNRTKEGLAWRKRLSALIAATGKQEDEILDEALSAYALQVLKSQETQNEG